jgi:chemotaxis protein MotB
MSLLRGNFSPMMDLESIATVSRRSFFLEIFAMSLVLRWSWFWPILCLALSGCAGNSMALQGKVADFEKQQAALTRQNQELTTRAAQLDKDHQESTRLVGMWQQQAKAFDDEKKVLQDQLRAVNDQLARARSEKDATEQKAKTLNASLQRQGGVPIVSNNSLLSTVPVINLPEVIVRKDGDVIRVALPGNRLFDPGSNRLRPGAAELVANAAGEVLRAYPDQVIAIEGHTDNNPVVGSQFRNSRDLSSARAMSVYDILASRLRVPEDQLIVVGHGANRPCVSNGPLEGKQLNNRVELVVYPDRRPGR